MRWSIPLFKARETQVRIHLTFLLLLLWIAIANYSRGGTPAAINGTVFVLAIFLCVLLHEFGHVLAARAYGIPTPDITLLPIGGVARLQRMPDKPAQELVVAIAGPAVNVVIAAGLYLGLGGAAQIYDPDRLHSPAVSLLSKLLTVNLWLVLFNLIPAFPMDGGRVLRAVLAMRMDYARATRAAATAGQFLAFVFGFIGLFTNPLLIFIAFFIYLGAGQEAAVAEMRAAARGLSVTDVMITDFRSLPTTATLHDAVEALLRTSQHDFPVTDASTQQIVGLLTRKDLITALRERGPTAAVADVMHRDVPTIPASAPFDRAFELMNESQSPALLVRTPDGRLIGLVTPENLSELMLVQSALAAATRTGAAPPPPPPPAGQVAPA